MSDVLKVFPQGVQAFCALFGALALVCTALHSLFALVALKAPAAQKAADLFGSVGWHLQSWAQWLGQMAKTIGTATMGAGLFVLVLMVSISGCSVFTPKRIHGIEQITDCVLEHRDLPKSNIAMVCGVEDAQDVVDIITGEERRMAAARHAGQDEGRILGCIK